MTWETDRIADLESQRDDLDAVATELAALDGPETEEYVIQAAMYGRPMPQQVADRIGQLDDQITALGG